MTVAAIQATAKQLQLQLLHPVPQVISLDAGVDLGEASLIYNQVLGASVETVLDLESSHCWNLNADSLRYCSEIVWLETILLQQEVCSAVKHSSKQQVAVPDIQRKP